MPSLQRLLGRAVNLRRRFVGDSGYALAYGSHAKGLPSGASSDLDLLFVAPTSLSPSRIAQLVDAVVDLHVEFALELDTEVSFAVKLHATFADVSEAISLRQFMTGGSQLAVPAVVPEPSYLNSENFRIRLIFNALTSPHVFLGGDVNCYDDHCQEAERALAVLAQALATDRDSRSSDVAMRALLTGPDGTTGKDYLGYRAGPHLYATLSRGRARLEHMTASPDDERRGHGVLPPETMGGLSEGAVL